MARSRRLLVVSNRLPFSVQRGAEGPELIPSAGGLVTALSSYLERRRREEPELDFLWAGWAGGEVSPDELPAVREKAQREHGAYPIALPAREMEQFYSGFCNGTLWPLFHYFPDYVTYRQQDFDNYRAMNQRFCEALLELVRPGDEIWVHDYHLLLLPALLREKLPDASIGFFLHIPFPSFEVFRQLPTEWRNALLEGMVGADLIGFHTHDYVQYFLHSVFRSRGYEHHLGQLRVGDAVKRVEAFPIGIDFERFWQAASSPEVNVARERLRAQLGPQKLICSVDRLDYSKGILHRLRGYETLLREREQYRGQVTLVLAVVPSREQVDQYQRMKQELEQLVGRINGSYGSVAWTPIVYQYRSLPFTELVALYSAADVALVTPLRDGMNLVAKEYLASKPDGSGVLVLSEMTGAARELSEALQVNPNHAGEIAQAIHLALSMEREEQVHRNRAMQERLRAYDATRWVTNFLGALRRTKERQGQLDTLLLSGAALDRALQSHARAQQRALLLDYDGTLVPITSESRLAAPDAALLELLERLRRLPGQVVYLVSGRDRHTLDRWFGTSGLGIIAEHGAWLRHPAGTWTVPTPVPAEWKNQLRALVEQYVERVPGSALEEKDYSLAWHYRGADPELGIERAKELSDDVAPFASRFEVQVLEGKKVVEIRHAGVSKGAAASALLAAEPADFVLAAGDDETDEDLFRALPPGAWTVKVGGTHSLATYRMRDHRELRALLERLAQHEGS